MDALAPIAGQRFESARSTMEAAVPRALRVCPTPGCPELVASGRCDTCRAEAECRRGSAAQRGYGHRHRVSFRRRVLARDPLCTCTDQALCADRHGPVCLAAASDADHWPRDKRELRRLGLDEHDPQYGRGLCKGCHGRHTADAQPGGWNA